MNKLTILMVKGEELSLFTLTELIFFFLDKILFFGIQTISKIRTKSKHNI